MNESTSFSQKTDVLPPPQTSTPTVPHAESRIAPVQISPVVSSPTSTGSPPDQITALMDMIHFHSEQIRSLQSQLITVTTEMIKMRENQQAIKPVEEKTTESKTTYLDLDSTVSTQPPSASILVQQDTPTRPRKISKKKTQPAPRKDLNSVPMKKSKSLIIGDSLIKNINEKGLHGEVHCHGVSGATVEIISRRIKMFNLKEFSTVVISVGGNDSSNKVDVEYFEKKLDQIIQYIKTCNFSCEIILCGICPRSDCDVTQYNEILHGLAAENKVQSVLMEQSFSDNKGNQTHRFFAKDGIHFSPSGVRRFLDTIQKSCKVNLVSDFKFCAYVQRRNAHNQTRGESKCFKCGETNHSTFQCRHRYRLRCHKCNSMGHKQSKCSKA